MENKVDFEYGDLYVVCSKGHKTKMGENIPTGIQFLLFNKHEQFIELSCPECDKEYTLKFQLFPAENPPAPEIEDAEIIEEEITNEIQNELQESTAEGQDI